MYNGENDAFRDGGQVEVILLVILIIVIAVVGISGRIIPKIIRAASGIYGSTDWASSKELPHVKGGIELGIDPNTGDPVRFPIEGNILTIAPPRKGKTSGYVLPTLACGDPESWDGPVVVIDPKGEAYRASRRRRQEVGHVVRCLDPANHVGGADRWNPLHKIASNNVLYMQSVARSLLPKSTSADTSNAAFFNNTAVSIVVGAMIAIAQSGYPSPVMAADLIADPDKLKQLLAKNRDPASNAAAKLLDEKNDTVTSILATADQAMQWLRDSATRANVESHTFELKDLCTGKVDLFVVLPADSTKEILAPYIRAGSLPSCSRPSAPIEKNGGCWRSSMKPIYLGRSTKSSKGLRNSLATESLSGRSGKAVIKSKTRTGRLGQTS
jgi:type IV secretion system protein VirD4